MGFVFAASLTSIMMMCPPQTVPVSSVGEVMSVLMCVGGKKQSG